MLYQLPQLRALPHLVHGFSTRKAGNMSFRWGKADEVHRNRERFCKSLNINPHQVATAELEHADRIVRVTMADAGYGILGDDYKLKADALITDEPNLALFHMVADCASLLYYDLAHHAIGLAHAGWHGTTETINTKIVQRMNELFGTDPANLTVGIGPAILSCCYAYPEPKQKTLAAWATYLTDDTQGLTHIDNVGYIVDQLKAAGVKAEHIYPSQICTAHDERFFSHYRDKKAGLPDQGRFAALISLRV